jgi:hypothetical protein
VADIPCTPIELTAFILLGRRPAVVDLLAGRIALLAVLSASPCRCAIATGSPSAVFWFAPPIAIICQSGGPSSTSGGALAFAILVWAEMSDGR